VRLVEEGPAWTVESRTFRGSQVVVRLRPAEGPDLEAELPLREAPEEGARVGVEFRVEDVVVLGDDGP
jgi:thiamine transport system ATP-binding protein